MNSLLSNVYDLLKYKTEKVSCNQRSNSLFCFIKAQTLIIQNRWYNKVYSCEFLRTVKKNMPTIGTLSLLLDGIYFSL